MAKLIILFACAALLEVASALTCYFCFKDSCYDDITRWQKTECIHLFQQNKEAVCATVTYTDKYTKKEYLKRSCEIVDKGVTNRCTVADAEDVTCTTCTTDLCNSATNVYLSEFIVTGLLVAYFLPKFSM